MSFDMYGLADLYQSQTGDEVDPNDPLAALRRPGGVNLSQASRPEMNAERQRAIQENAKAQQAARRTNPFATHNPMQQDFIRNFGPGAQANALGGMIQQTTDAIQDENDSRVAQEREWRRMQHEKEMKQMELDALLARLQAARQ